MSQPSKLAAGAFAQQQPAIDTSSSSTPKYIEALFFLPHREREAESQNAAETVGSRFQRVCWVIRLAIVLVAWTVFDCVRDLRRFVGRRPQQILMILVAIPLFLVLLPITMLLLLFRKLCAVGSRVQDEIVPQAQVRLSHPLQARQN